MYLGRPDAAGSSERRLAVLVVFYFGILVLEGQSRRLELNLRLCLHPDALDRSHGVRYVVSIKHRRSSSVETADDDCNAAVQSTQYAPSPPLHSPTSTYINPSKLTTPPPPTALLQRPRLRRRHRLHLLRRQLRHRQIQHRRLLRRRPSPRLGHIQ